MNEKKVIEILENKYGWINLSEAKGLLKELPKDIMNATIEAFSLKDVVASFKCRKEEIFGEDKCKKECEDCLEYYKSN